MANKFLKSNQLIILVAVVVAAGGFLGWKYLQSRKYAVPKGIASGNGRVEATLVDATAKEPLRVKDILVDEGDLVQPGQVLVHLDTITLDAQLAEAKANVAAAQERLAVVNATISKAKSQVALAKIEVDRAEKLLEDRASSQREVDVRRTTLETANASLAEARAQLLAAQQQVQVAEANVAAVQSRINDATLVSPVLGRVLYRLAEPGEVLGPGGKALTLVNLDDVYMEIFLPAAEAGPLKLGGEGRITIDNQPGRSAPALVSFVSPEAQFTPKQVETKSEREKLMFRVKLQVPKSLVQNFIESIKTGVRGVGYVKVNPSATWPEWLEQGLVTAPQSQSTPATQAAAPESAPATAPAAVPATDSTAGAH
jgi:HlyD family secretion protein